MSVWGSWFLALFPTSSCIPVRVGVRPHQRWRVIFLRGLGSFQPRGSLLPPPDFHSPDGVRSCWDREHLWSGVSGYKLCPFLLIFHSPFPWFPGAEYIVGTGNILFFFFLFFLRAEPEAYGSSQARQLNQSYSCWPTPQPQQLRIQALSATYTAGHSSAGFLTHRGRPAFNPKSSWILVRFITTEPQWKLLGILFYNWSIIAI